MTGREETSEGTRLSKGEGDRNGMRNIFKTTAAAVISGLLLGAASMPAWPATYATEASAIEAEVMPAKVTAAAPMPAPRLLDASRSDVSSRRDRTNCKAGHIYSRHDIVGDPGACIMGRLAIGAR